MSELQPMELDKLLRYQNNRLITAFTKKFAISEQESQLIFQDMLRFLYLTHHSAQQKLGVRVAIDRSLLVIDEMWHLFILHTRDYAQFCQQEFGYFVHHEPTSPQQHLEFATQMAALSPEQQVAALADLKRPLYYLVFNLFGEDIFTRWFNHYPHYAAIVQGSQQQGERND